MSAYVMNGRLASLGWLIVTVMLLSACGGSSNARPSEPRIPVPDNSQPEDPRGPGFCDDPAALLRLDNIFPNDGVTSAPVNTAIVLRFSHPVRQSSVGEDNVLVSANGAPVPVTRVVNGRTVTLLPQQVLQQATEYVISVGAGVSAAECADGEKTLAPDDVRDYRFSTSGQNDLTQPFVERVTPADGALLVQIDSTVEILFSEPVLPGSVTGNSVRVIRESTGQPVQGDLDVDGALVRFTPAAGFVMQSDFRVEVTTNVRDLAGNALREAAQSRFRTGGVVVFLNDNVIDRIPGLGDVLNFIGGNLLSVLDLGNADDGLGNLDNLVVLRLPLLTDFPQIGLDGASALFTDDVLVAVCDPAAPAKQCVLALNIGLDPLALGQLADAFTGGDPSQIPGLLAEALIGEGGVLGVDLRLLDPEGLGLLPGPLEDAVNLLVGQLRNALDQVPIINTLFATFDLESLVQVGLLNGAVLDVRAGGLLQLSLLDLSTGSVVNLSGGLTDALAPVLSPLTDVLCRIRLLCLT